ncbi:MAG: hypothetical protein WCC14_09200 [Acidobacteriaceae bacterium]
MAACSCLSAARTSRPAAPDRWASDPALITLWRFALTISLQPERWNRRDALRVGNGIIEALFLTGGGHIAELRLARPSALNCLWTPHWPGADPGDPRLPALTAAYGGDPAGAFLAGYTGHALCLDLFGMPDKDEAARGVALHGEASIRRWSYSPAPGGCVGRVDLPVAQLGFERAISLAEGAPLLFVTETVTNHGNAARDIHWVQHLSLGPPLLAPGTSRIFASLDRAKTWPLGYDGRELLRNDAEFIWPNAPSVTGEAVDLRIPFQRLRTGFIAAARVDPAHELGWIVAANPGLGLALFCCFRREDFPWVAIWEENRARRGSPWNKTTQARGMEFGTTPMPIGREAIRKLGPLFDTPVSRNLRARASLRARYVLGIAEIPAGIGDIARLEVARDAISLIGASPAVQVPVPGLRGFLLKGTQA